MWRPTGSVTTLAKKFLPKRRADVLRFGALLVIFFFFPFFPFFAGVPFQSSNRGKIDKTRGLFCIILSISERRPPGPYCMWSITARQTRNPAMSAAQLFTPNRAPHGMISTSFTLSLSSRSHQVGRSVITLRRPRVLEILSEPNFCPPLPFLLSHLSPVRTSTFWVCRFGKSNYPGT